MRQRRIGILRLAGLLTAAMFVTNPVSAMAVNTVTLPLEIYGEDVISVVFPAISEDGDSPFDFIMDPQGLIYKTAAAKYGGGSVEEGATLLFRNHNGEYDFSRYSDRLTIRNQSNVPVIVTITASISNLGEVDVVGSPDFGESKACSMYLAIVDDEGNEQPVSENGEVSVSIKMRRTPDNAYVYRIDEETGNYRYELSGLVKETDFDSYSFGLKGCCNPNGEWQNIITHPSIRVTWKVEPVLSEDSYSKWEQENTDTRKQEDTDTGERENADTGKPEGTVTGERENADTGNQEEAAAGEWENADTRMPEETVTWEQESTGIGEQEDTVTGEEADIMHNKVEPEITGNTDKADQEEEQKTEINTENRDFSLTDAEDKEME